MARKLRVGRWTPQSPTAFVVGALAIIIVLLAVAALATIESNDISARTARSLATSDLAERLLGNVRDAETGQRGYLLTGRADYLGPYVAAGAAVDDTYAKLAEAVADRPRQAERVSALKAPIDDKMAELDKTISLAKAGKRAEAMAIVAQGTGKVAMDDIRTRIEQIELAEGAERIALRAADARREGIDLAAFGVAVAGLILLGWWLLRTGQVRARELEELNATLEERVSERTAALQREQNRFELMLHDMNHRVGNNLAVIAAIMGLQRRASPHPEVKEALAAAEERIAAVGATQRRLRLSLDSDEVDARQFFGDLIGDFRTTIGDRPITLAARIDEVRLPGREAVTYGIIVNELLTNCGKHAFPEDIAGTVTLSVSRLDDGAIHVEVVDDGVGLPAGETRGLGTTILTNLARSLGAVVHVEAAAAAGPRPGVKAGFTVSPRAPATTAENAVKPGE